MPLADRRACQGVTAPNMSRYGAKRVRRSVIDTIASKVLSQIATLIGYVVLVRGISEHDFGVLNLFYSFIPLIGTIASFGLDQTLRRYEPEYLRAGNPVAADWLYRTVGKARFGSTVLLLLIVILVWQWIGPLLKVAPYRAEFMLFGILVTLHFQGRILQFSMASHMLHRFSMGSLTVLAVSKLAAYAIFFALGGITLTQAVLADVVAYGIMFLTLKYLHRKHCEPVEREAYQPPREEVRRWVRYGFYNSFNDAGTWVLNTRSDNFFIAAFLGPVAVGVYAFYVRLGDMASNVLPVRVFDNIVKPLFFSIEPSQAEQRIPRYFSLLLDLSLAPQMPVLAFTAAYSTEVVHVLFGGKFLEYAYLLPLMTLFSTLNLCSGPVTTVAQYEEKSAALLISKVFALYNVAAMLVLLPIMGVLGAALATGTAQLMKNAFIWWRVRQMARWREWPSVVLTTVGIWTSVVAACLLLKRVADLPEIADLVIGAILCGLAALLHIRSGAVSRSDRELLGTVLSGRERRWLARLGFVSSTD
jgi:O-antigen/teichoic acid export membrane protein